MSFPGDVYTSLLNGQAFPEGTALKAWLGTVQALDANGMLDIYYARHDADVGLPGHAERRPIQIDPWGFGHSGACLGFRGGRPSRTAYARPLAANR
jgi:hypothetical protein